MKTKKILVLGFLLVLLGSCKDFLEPYPAGIYDSELLWENQSFVQGLIGQCYDNMPRNYNDNEGAYLDGATDDAVITSTTNNMSRLATGALPTSLDPFQTYWDRDYRSIYLCNLFLKDRRGYNTRYLVGAYNNNLVRRRLQGEAFALRAWFQWDLLQKFGGKSINGDLLGFPIVLEPVDVNKEVNFERNTYDDCVKQIVADCDSAIKYLVLAHRDFLTNPLDLAYAGGKYWGRFDGISMRALKAKVYLTWASPRFNPATDITRYDSAAANARRVMNFKLTKDNVTGGFVPATGVNWTDPNSPDIVISARYQGGNDAMERMFYPAGFQGDGVIGPTQELVDAFPMANGFPINDPANRGGYNPANPYLGRDPRFYSAIWHNDAKVMKPTPPTATWYTFDISSTGADAPGKTQKNTLTGYYVRKFIYAPLNWADKSPTRGNHSKFYLTWTQMCLIFAEAANQVGGPKDTKYGISAQTALQYLRARKTYLGANGISTVLPPNPPSDTYLLEVANAGKNAFHELVKNEWRIETCFEGIRFFDLRRWTTDLADLNMAVHGVTAVKSGTTYVYNLNSEVQNRSFTSAFLPIPYSEMLRMSKLVQNEGWPQWN